MGKVNFTDILVYYFVFVTFVLNHLKRDIFSVFLPGKKAYLPQGDYLHGFYTCTSYMQHYARLTGMTLDEETNKKIDDILTDLGLASHKNTRVGDVFLSGLSGGQKRRLGIALEALSSPQNFFLDEPTSGLDAESAIQVVRFLRRYVQMDPGRRVILTIHQPSSFIWEMLDNIILLAKGHLVYQGPREETKAFFDSCDYHTPVDYNPADYFLTITNDDFDDKNRSPEWWNSAFLNWNKKVVDDDGDTQEKVFSTNDDTAETQRGNFCQQVTELVRRYFTNLMFNPGILAVRVAIYAMLALIIGALFWKIGDVSTYTSIQSRIALAYYCAAFFIFMSIAVMPFIIIERSIVDKEVRNGYYHPVVYQLAQGINSIPGSALLAFVTTVIIMTMTGFQEPLLYFVTMFLALLCAEALNQLISHVVPHFIIGMALVAGFFGLFMLLQGFMLVPSEFPSWLRWTYNIAFHTYAWRLFMYFEFHDNHFPNALPEKFKDGNNILKEYEIYDISTTNDLVTLLGYAGVIQCLSFVVVYLKYKRSRQVNVQKIGNVQDEGTEDVQV